MALVPKVEPATIADWSVFDIRILPLGLKIVNMPVVLTPLLTTNTKLVSPAPDGSMIAGTAADASIKF